MSDRDRNSIPAHTPPLVLRTSATVALHFSFCEIQSRMLTSDPYALDLDYTRTMMGFLLFNSEPEAIAMIGLGGGSLAKFCHRNLPDTRIQVAEINPHVIALRDEFLIPADDHRFTVVLADGADFVRTSSDSVDVLMVDGYSNEGIPSALSSQDFYDDCHNALRPDGLMVVNLHAGHCDYETHIARIQRSFGNALLVLRNRERSNSIVFACRGELMRRYRPRLPRRPRHMSPLAWRGILNALTKASAATLDGNAWNMPASTQTASEP